MAPRRQAFARAPGRPPADLRSRCRSPARRQAEEAAKPLIYFRGTLLSPGTAAGCGLERREPMRKCRPGYRNHRLNAGLGDRIIELGCIEVLSRRVTGNHFTATSIPSARASKARSRCTHRPRVPPGQTQVREIAAEFLDYIQGAELVIHTRLRRSIPESRAGRLGLPRSKLNARDRSIP